MTFVNPRDRVRVNEFGDGTYMIGRTGIVYETWTDGPNEDYPQADVIWNDDGTSDIVPFEELELVDGD